LQDSFQIFSSIDTSQMSYGGTYEHVLCPEAIKDRDFN